MKKLQVYHFHGGKQGGVHAVIKNLVNYSGNPNINNHVIYTINKETGDNNFISSTDRIASEQFFYYSAKWNFYHTCKQLARLLPGEDALIVAHDWIELGMASNLGLQNPVAYILHGDFDYYYELAVKHNHIIDAFICISPVIADTLKKKLPLRLHDIYYQNFPVPAIPRKVKLNEALHLVYYVGDLGEDRKQFSTIIKIAESLSRNADKYFFTIAGGGITEEDFFCQWPAKMKDRVNFLGLQSNEKILSILPSQDIFLLPSLKEGLPVSLVEAMKAGVIPLITNWGGAVDELVRPGITGFYFSIGDPEGYVTCIEKLSGDRELLQKLSENCTERANELFDPEKNTGKFEKIFLSISAAGIKRKKPVKIYGSRLDQPWLPNFITNLWR